jgi:hypothetical protein
MPCRYEMPDVDFRQSEEFKSLDGQSMPKGDLLDSVFRQARFDTRFYEELPSFSRTFKADHTIGGLRSSVGGAGPAKFLVSYASTAPFGAPGRVPTLAHIVKGLVRLRCFLKINATTLDRFERVEADVPSFVALFELESEEAVKAWQEEFKEFYDRHKVEVGYYRLKRVYV